MKLLIRCAAGLYPSAWRARYGAELEALVEDMDCGWLEFLDICKGAMKMQILSGGAWRFVAACAVAGLAIAGVTAWHTPSQYRSMAVLRMAPGDPDQRIEMLNKAEQQILSRGKLAAVIQKYDLYPEERKRNPLEDIVLAMRNRQIQIRLLDTPGPQTASNAFSIAFDYDEPGKAQTVTRELTSAFIAATRDSAAIEVLDPASLPQRSFAPNRPAWLIMGLVLGLAAAMLAMGIRRWPLVPLAGIAVAVVVLGVTYLVPDQYRSQAVLRSRTVNPGEAATKVVKDREYLQSLVTQSGLYPKEPDAVDRMQRSLTIRNVETPRARVCIVSFEYPDRYKAYGVLQQIVARVNTVEVLDPPSLPEQAFWPNRLAIALAALFSGLVMGGIALAVRRHRTPAVAGQ